MSDQRCEATWPGTEHRCVLGRSHQVWHKLVNHEGREARWNDDGSYVGPAFVSDSSSFREITAALINEWMGSDEPLEIEA